MLLLENLNLLQFLKPGEHLRGSDEAMQELKKAAMENRYLIKTCLNVTISEKFTPIAIAQKLLAKIDLKLNYVGRLGKRENRECVYKFVPPDDRRGVIFDSWLNRELVSVNNNKELPTQITDTIPLSISAKIDSVSVNNNIELSTQVADRHHTLQTLNDAVGGWKGLKMKMREGLDSAGRFYTELVSQVGSAVGVADGEPYWNGYLGQWQVWVNFESDCRSVVCDWLFAV
ncbi:MAG: hypothetical protein V7L05_20150 [Nostoc sp.]|uniref:hypothetical protein n=1 Tax=Nostoc sp. TaxID=1180 RepID=UPI002FF58161